MTNRQIHTHRHRNTVFEYKTLLITHTHTHTHTHTPVNGLFSVTTRMSQYQKGKTNLDFTEARDKLTKIIKKITVPV